jgi:hypothetical protein
LGPAGCGRRLTTIEREHDMRIAQMKNVEVEFVRFTAGIRFTPGIVFGLLTLAMAASLSPAAGETVREACTNDAFRLCSDAIPDVRKTKDCLAHNRTSLSPLCKAAFASAGIPRRHHRH